MFFGKYKSIVLSEAFEYFMQHQDVFYLIGSAVGPSPYPKMVKYFQKIIGEEARKQIIADLDEKGLLIKSEELVHNVATHERCGHPMEFILKKQWFIKIVEDKQKFLDAINDDLNYPLALGVVYTLVKNEPKSKQVYDLILDFLSSYIEPLQHSAHK